MTIIDSLTNKTLLFFSSLSLHFLGNFLLMHLTFFIGLFKFSLNFTVRSCSLRLTSILLLLSYLWKLLPIFLQLLKSINWFTLAWSNALKVLFFFCIYLLPIENLI